MLMFNFSHLQRGDAVQGSTFKIICVFSFAIPCKLSLFLFI